MARLPSPNDDVARAVVEKWSADGTLAALVPGKLQQARLSSYQPEGGASEPRQSPYANLTVTKEKEGLHQTFGHYLDFRLATVEVRGRKADVEAALEYVRDPNGDQSGGLFNRQTLNTVAPFVACLQLEEDDLRQDPEQKAADDVWIGTIRLSVWTARPE